MNSRLLTVFTLLLTAGVTMPARSANQDELSILNSTGKCVDCNLSSTNISQQDLRDADLEGANLYKTNLTDSDLRDANFSDSNSQKTNFDGSDLRNADFSYANVSGASFCGADLRGANWKSISYDEHTQCLPDKALDLSSTARNNSLDSPRSISDSVENVKKNTESVKKTADTVKDIFRLF